MGGMLMLLAACTPLYRGQTAYGVSIAPPDIVATIGRCFVLNVTVRNHSSRVRYLSLLTFTTRMEVVTNPSSRRIRISLADRVHEGDPPHHPQTQIHHLRPFHALRLRIELPLPINHDPVQETWFSPPGGHYVKDLSPPFYVRVEAGILPSRPDITHGAWPTEALAIQRLAESEEVAVVTSSSSNSTLPCHGQPLEVIDGL